MCSSLKSFLCVGIEVMDEVKKIQLTSFCYCEVIFLHIEWWAKFALYFVFQGLCCGRCFVDFEVWELRIGLWN